MRPGLEDVPPRTHIRQVDPIFIVGGSLLALTALVASAWAGARRLGWLSGERTVGSTDEDADAFGRTAIVVERLEGTSVRIQFQGTTWPARLIHDDAHVGVGAEVRILDRDNLIWIVEPIIHLKPQ